MSLFTCQHHGLHHGQFCPTCGGAGHFTSLPPPREKPRDEPVEWPADFHERRGEDGR